LPLLKALQEREPLAWTGIQSANGKELYDRGGPSTYSGSEAPGGYARVEVLPLKNLLRDVTAIGSCRGKAAVKLPAKVEVVRFEKPKSGATGKAGTATVTVKKADTREQTSTFNGQTRKSLVQNFEIEVKGAPQQRVFVAAYDAQQRLLGPSPFGMAMRSSFGDVSTVHYAVAGEAAVLAVKVITDAQDAAYEFSLDNIPLQHAGEMPVQLEPAKFPGHDAPVTVELLQIRQEGGFPKMRMRATNHSDKDIRALEMKIIYPGYNGKMTEVPAAYKPRLADPVWDLTEGRHLAKWDANPMPVAVARQASAEFEPTSWSNPPKEVKGTTIRLERVEFTDGSEWKAK
jgi:hypothetical protein